MLHAPCAESLTRARRNLVNLKVARPDASVIIVANGAAVAAALKTPDATDDALRLCRNSLKAQGLVNARGLTEVDAAVVTLAENQAAGWAYIRA